MRIDSRQKLLALLAGVAFALLIGDRLIATPLTKLWKARSEEIAGLRKKVEQGRSMISREQFIRGRWNEMQTNILPTDASQAEQQVLKAFDNWAAQSGVSVNSIMPQWKRDSDNYTTLECRVEAAGDLETLSRFLYEIEKDPMALKLESVELNARDNAGQQMTLGLQVSGLVLAQEQR